MCYVGILGQAKTIQFSAKKKKVRYVRDAGIEPESIPMYRVLHTYALNIVFNIHVTPGL